MEKFYSIKEVADNNFIGFKRTKIFKLIQAGELKAVNLCKDKNKRPILRIPESAILEYIKKNAKKH